MCFRQILRSLGGFFIRRRLDKTEGKKDHLYRAVLKEVCYPSHRVIQWLAEQPTAVWWQWLGAASVWLRLHSASIDLWWASHHVALSPHTLCIHTRNNMIAHCSLAHYSGISSLVEVLGSRSKDLGSSPRHVECPLWKWAAHVNPSSYCSNKPQA